MLEQRAWINIEDGNVREPFDPSKIIRIDFKTKNSGKTPALHVKYGYRMWIQYFGQKIAEGKKSFDIELTYGPGDERINTLSTNSPYPEPMIKPLQSGDAIIFIELEFTYRDIYNKKKLHHTCACFYYNPVYPPTVCRSVKLVVVLWISNIALMKNATINKRKISRFILSPPFQRNKTLCQVNNPGIFPNQRHNVACILFMRPVG